MFISLLFGDDMLMAKKYIVENNIAKALPYLENHVLHLILKRALDWAYYTFMGMKRLWI